MNSRIVAKSLDRVSADLAHFRRDVQALVDVCNDVGEFLEAEAGDDSSYHKTLARLRQALAEVELWY